VATGERGLYSTSFNPIPSKINTYSHTHPWNLTCFLGQTHSTQPYQLQLWQGNPGYLNPMSSTHSCI
jgi:hypothetical protein